MTGTLDPPTALGPAVASALLTVTEAAALAASTWVGRSDKDAADGAAVDAMRSVLTALPMRCTVVIGEGEKDEAPMLYRGEQLGSGGPGLDIAVDPVDGTTLAAKGLPGAVAVIGASPHGTMLDPPAVHYMDKLVVGPELAGTVDIEASPAENVHRVARARGVDVEQVTVCVLDRPRHDDLVREICRAGARVRRIPDGDVVGALAAALPDTGVDLLLGVGGTPEGILTACAIRCVGGHIQGRLQPLSPAERAAADAAGFDLGTVLHGEDLVSGQTAAFALTGITDGLVPGVRRGLAGARTHSLLFHTPGRSMCRTDTRHP